MKSTLLDNIACRRLAPLLARHAEGLLRDADAARVDAHLERCERCQSELDALIAVGLLLRAHPPTPAQPAADLWSRIEAEIAPAPTSSPAPVRGRVHWWRPGLALPAGLAAVAAFAGVAAVVVSKNPRPDADVTPIAAVTPALPSTQRSAIAKATGSTPRPAPKVTTDVGVDDPFVPRVVRERVAKAEPSSSSAASGSRRRRVAPVRRHRPLLIVRDDINPKPLAPEPVEPTPVEPMPVEPTPTTAAPVPTAVPVSVARVGDEEELTADRSAVQDIADAQRVNNLFRYSPR